MEILERLVFRETVREALQLMTGYELLLAAGRAAGMRDKELADLLNIEPATVSYHLGQARKRIMDEIPELRVTLSGRCRRAGERTDPDEEEGCSLEEVAEELGITAETVALWIQERRFESACRVGKEWRISRQELESVPNETQESDATRLL